MWRLCGSRIGLRIVYPVIPFEGHEARRFRRREPLDWVERIWGRMNTSVNSYSLARHKEFCR